MLFNDGLFPMRIHIIVETLKLSVQRNGLIDEYRRIGKNSEWVDKRIGQSSTKMSEEEKMKLRYLREQKERAKSALLGNNNVKTARKKSKFNLGSDDEDQDVMIGFTHKGRRLGEIEDDFKEQIDISSEDEGVDRDKGKLTEEMVNRMNFGGGDEEVSQATVN